MSFQLYSWCSCWLTCWIISQLHYRLYRHDVLPYHNASFAKSPCRRRLSLVLFVCEKNKSKDLLWQGNQSELTSGFFYVKSHALTHQSLFSFYLHQVPYTKDSAGLSLHLQSFQYPNGLPYHYFSFLYSTSCLPAYTNASVYHIHPCQLPLFSYLTEGTK